jgi:hypothetical protein
MFPICCNYLIWRYPTTLYSAHAAQSVCSWWWYVHQHSYNQWHFVHCPSSWVYRKQRFGAGHCLHPQGGGLFSLPPNRHGTYLHIYLPTAIGLMPDGSVYIKWTNTDKMHKTQTTEQTNTQHLKPITQNGFQKYHENTEIPSRPN